MIKILPIASGSTGNCMLVDVDGRKVIVDLGVTASALRTALAANGYECADIDAVLITHTHTDHVKGLDVCMKRLAAPLFMSSTSKATLLREDAVGLNYNTRCEILQGLWLTAFPTAHDCPGSVGYLIETENHRFGYATDLGVVTDKIMDLLAGADCIVIESNHDEEMLRYGRYPVFLKKRILSEHGHLSNEACAEAVAWFADRGTKHFLLAHLSQENNRPDLALACAERAVAGMDVTIDVLPVSGDRLIQVV
ncbi:MAG: MBL fold metallo-hydrolase [Oscillospiraceae bacterium]|nr:MBL fold metallo-hydrolase [Oscillospiraceae bacterium]